jgi:hypothetical protein
MHSVLKGILAVVGVLALAGPAAAQFGGPPPPPNTGVPLFTHLTGGSGDGHATVVVDPPKGTACYIVNVGGLPDVTAAHIHLGGPGENGRVVVPFDTPDGGTAGGCAQVTAEVAQALIANPGGYYVNVHTRQFPAGAIRGQLMK